jgi:hypothetical protein
MIPARTHDPTAAPAAHGTWLYRTSMAVAGIVAAILVAFFVIGIGDGSVSSFNIALWLGTLALVAAVILGGYGLHTHGHNRAAAALLAVLALPELLYGLFVLRVVFSGARWN